MRHTPASLTVLISMLLTACNGANPDAPTPTERGAAPDTPALPEATAPASERAITYAGPPFTFDVQADASATNFNWSVTVPTGGWTLAFKSARIDPRANHATIMVILVRPDPEAMVTQALETLKGSYRHNEMQAATAELMVKLLEHDQADTQGEFKRAAWWPAE